MQDSSLCSYECTSSLFLRISSFFFQSGKNTGVMCVPAGHVCSSREVGSLTAPGGVFLFENSCKMGKLEPVTSVVASSVDVNGT